MNTTIGVTACKNCPFFERTLAHVAAEWLADAITKQSAKTRAGTCKNKRPAAFGEVFAGRPFYIADEEIVPDQCPLRNCTTTIELIK